MDYNKQTIVDEISNFKYTMKQTNIDILPAEMVDGLMRLMEQYTDILHQISTTETLDDLETLKQNAACEDVRPDVVIWAVRQVVRVILAADSLHQTLTREQ